MTPFQQAFADARSAGKKEFTFNGKPYHTRMKGEKAAPSNRAAEAPPQRTAKATVSQTVRPTGTTKTTTVSSKRATAGAIPAISARPKLDAAGRMLDRNLTGKGATTSPSPALQKLKEFASNALKPKVAVAKTTTSSPATGKTTTTMAALKANRRDFSRAGVEAKKLATMTGPKVARKK